MEKGVISPSLLRLTLQNDKINDKYFENIWDFYMLGLMKKEARNACLVHLPSAKKIGEMDIPAKIVFATGYGQFAIQAFDLEAFDYILKPYDEERIRRIVERLQNRLAEREQNRAPGEITAFSQKISLQTIDRVVMINPVQEIVFICTEKSDCSLFYTTKGIITQT